MVYLSGPNNLDTKDVAEVSESLPPGDARQFRPADLCR